MRANTPRGKPGRGGDGPLPILVATRPSSKLWVPPSPRECLGLDQLVAGGLFLEKEAGETILSPTLAFFLLPSPTAPALAPPPPPLKSFY